MEIVVRFKTRAKQVSRPFYHERSVRDQGGEESSGSATASVETIHSLKPNMESVEVGGYDPESCCCRNKKQD